MNWHQTIAIGAILNDYEYVDDPDHFYLDDLDRWLQGYFAPQWERYFDSEEHQGYASDEYAKILARRAEAERVEHARQRRAHLAAEQRRQQGTLL